MNNQELKTAFDKALHNFIKDDHELLRLDANERTISHKFAEHLQREFSEWDVDCEYNRLKFQKKVIDISRDKWKELVNDGKAPETISYEDLMVGDEPTTVFPDIIVHHRNIEDNLLVIEIKKAKSPDIGWDEHKLRAYIRELDYKAGVLLVLKTGVKSTHKDDLIDKCYWP